MLRPTDVKSPGVTGRGGKSGMAGIHRESGVGVRTAAVNGVIYVNEPTELLKNTFSQRFIVWKVE